MRFTFKIFIISFILITTTQIVLAQQYKNSFILNLYYDNGNLRTDPDFEELNIEASVSDFVPPTRPYPLYTASLFDEQGELLISAKIDQRGGGYNIKQGIVKIIAPFDTKAGRVDIFTDKNQKVFSIPFKAADLCNMNGACDSVLGETESSCPIDCAPKTSLSQTNIIPTVTPPITQQSSGNGFVIAVWIFSGVVLATGLAMIYIAKKRRES